MIDGVKLTALQQFPDQRGRIMHMLRADDPHFERFGEIYFSTVLPGAIKGWHIHKRMTLNYAVVVGTINFVLYDERDGSPTKGEISEIPLGPDQYQLVTVPPMVWNGFEGISETEAIVANCATIPYDPDEIARLDPFTDQIPYTWHGTYGW